MYLISIIKKRASGRLSISTLQKDKTQPSRIKILSSNLQENKKKDFSSNVIIRTTGSVLWSDLGFAHKLLFISMATRWIKHYTLQTSPTIRNTDSPASMLESTTKQGGKCWEKLKKCYFKSVVPEVATFGTGDSL